MKVLPLLHDDRLVAFGDLGHGCHVHELSVQVHGHDRPRLGPHVDVFELVDVEQAVVVAVDEHDPGTEAHHGLGGGDERVGGHDHRVTGGDTGSPQRQFHGVGPVGDPDAMPHTTQRGELVLEPGHGFPADERAFGHGGVQFG